jgi:kynureninase
MIDRDDAKVLDAADQLSRWREEFVIPDPELIYLDGNSLG